MVAISIAGNSALEQLVEIFEKNGTISIKDADSVRKAIEVEQQKLLKERQELEAKEKYLLERERILQEKEEAIVAGGKPPGKKRR